MEQDFREVLTGRIDELFSEITRGLEPLHIKKITLLLNQQILKELTNDLKVNLWKV